MSAKTVHKFCVKRIMFVKCMRREDFEWSCSFMVELGRLGSSLVSFVWGCLFYEMLFGRYHLLRSFLLVTNLFTNFCILDK